MEQIIVPTGDHLLTVEPEQLHFQLELGKPARCTIKLSNDTKMLVAFKVRTLDHLKYDVQPGYGVVEPRSVSYISVFMEYPADKWNLDSKQSDDAFFIESVLGGPGITAKNALNLFKRPRCPVKRIEVGVVHTFLPHVGPCSPIVPVQQVRNLTRTIASQDASHLQCRNRNKRNAASQRAPTQLLLEGISNTNEPSSRLISTSGSALPVASILHKKILNPSQGKNGAPYGDGFRNVVAIRMFKLAYWFFTQMSHLIWGLRVLIAMFIVRIIGKLVDDSVEEWILKIACHYINELSSILYEKIVNMGLFSSSS